MTPWLLLFVTLGCAYVTYDAFRWRKGIKRAPFSVIANLWKGGLSHLSLAEKNGVKERFASELFGVGQISWLLFGVTVFLAAATVQAFLV